MNQMRHFKYLIAIIILILPVSSFASYGEEMYGRVMYGGIPGDVYDSALTLIGYTSQSQIGDLGGALNVILSASSDMSAVSNARFASGLSLAAQANVANAAWTINQAVVSLSAQGSITEASQLLAYGALILSSVASTGQVSSTNWIVLLNLSAQANLDIMAAYTGTAYDVYLSLATAASITEQANITMLGELTLSAQADMTTLLASVIKEGIVTLTAQGSLSEASQLAYYGAVILTAIATDTDRSNQIFSNVPLILSAIATAVIAHDFAPLEELIMGKTVDRRLYKKDSAARKYIKTVGPAK